MYYYEWLKSKARSGTRITLATYSKYIFLHTILQPSRKWTPKPCLTNSTHFRFESSLRIFIIINTRLIRYLLNIVSSHFISYSRAIFSNAYSFSRIFFKWPKIKLIYKTRRLVSKTNTWLRRTIVRQKSIHLKAQESTTNYCKKE